MTDISKALDDRLKILKEAYQVKEDIKIAYLPDADDPDLVQGTKGRVEGNTILIFEKDRKEALRTLTHEFYHHLVRDPRQASIDVHNSDIRIIAELLDRRNKDDEKRLNDAEEKMIEKLELGTTHLIERIEALQMGFIPHGVTTEKIGLRKP